MPIQKFRSLADARKALHFRAGTPEHFRAVRSVFWLAARLAPQRSYPPGVYKFRSIEEAQAQRKLWDRNETSKN